MGLTPPPCPRVNAGRLIPNEALRRRNAVCLFCGAARPTPPATWDVASQIAPCGAGKSNRKRKRNNAFSSVMPVFLFIIASALREAHDGSGPATAGAWGRHQPPHESTLTLLSKIISTRSYARKGITWDATSHVARGVRRAAPQTKSPTSKKPLRQFSKYSKLFFQRFLHLFYARKGTIWD